jgi:hypothetical protein
MPDVIVQRCTLRMVRAGGWSWGRSPDELVESALEALPELIEAACAGLEDHDDLEIATPARVTARVSLPELERRGPDALRAALSEALGGAARAGQRAGAGSDRPGGAGARNGEPARSADDGSAPVAQLPAPRDLLLRWLRDGVLDELLELLSPETLEAWHRDALGGGAARDDGAAAGVDPGTRRMVESLLEALPPTETRGELLRARIALAVAAAAPASDWPAAVALADAARPAPPSEAMAPGLPTGRAGAPVAEPPREPAHADEGAPRPSPPARPDRMSPARSPARPGETASASVEARALPFLVAAALGRIGYFDTLAASLAAAGLGARSRAFAAALAYKVADPPERGWRRGPEAQRAALAFAGAVVPADELTELAREAPRFASALDATIAVAVMSGRGREALVLHRDEAGALVLVDPAGGFPIAIGDGPEALARVLRSGNRPAVHVTTRARSAGVVETLRQARVPVDARRRAGRAPADLDRLDAALAALAERRAIPLAGDAGMEHTLTLAAGLGLAVLAWSLWADAGRTDPLLALERLGDLDARVVHGQDGVRVTLPLGRRHRDLREAGMLAALPALPWLGGKTVELRP